MNQHSVRQLDTFKFVEVQPGKQPIGSNIRISTT